MKKILISITTLIAVLAAITSCDLNNHPVFDDRNAFVAFNEAAYTVDEKDYTEADAVLKIPVTLSSVAGLSETVTYEFVDGEDTPTRKGAKKGVNYDAADPSMSLTFDAENRTVYIPVKIIPQMGIYTGDLSFSVKFSSTGKVSEGEANQCKITISDIDHPLSYILGTYVVSSTDDVGPISWEMEIRKDPDDVNKVWIYNLPNLADWAGDDILYYATVNTKANTMTVPLGQKSEYTYSNGKKVMLVNVTKVEGGSIFFEEEGNVNVDISADGKKLTFDPECGLGGLIEDTGFVSFALPGITAVKK